MKNKLIWLFCLVLLVSACGSGSDTSDEDKAIVSDAVSEGDYRIITSQASNNTRLTHADFNLGASSLEVGKGLMEYSKQHYSVDSYYLTEGQLISRRELQSVDINDKEVLLGRESEENSYGLNPKKESQFKISGSSEITVGGDTVPVIDIYELDFKKSADSDEVDGISVCIVMQSTITDKGGTTHTISDDTLFQYGSEQAMKLISFLRKKPEVGNSTPIYIMLYDNDSSDLTLPGRFVGEGYGKDNISISKIKEEWTIFPSDRTTELDSVTAQQFNAVKKELQMIIPNDTGIVGKGKFVDDRLDSLEITITAQAVTYTEISAIVQRMNDLMGTFDSDDYEIKVTILNNDEPIAMLKREKNSKDVTVITY